MIRSTLLLALLLASSGCARCSGSTAPTSDAGPDAAPEVMHVDVLGPPVPWTFTPVRVGPTFPGVSLPTGCSMREPIVRARVSESTRFVAAPFSLGTLVIADADVKETPPRLLGVAAMTLDPAGATSKPVALPWTDAGSMPRLARTNAGTWVAAYAEPAAGKLSEVFVYQNGEVTSMGEGDKFEAFDLSCHEDTCLLLTTRLSQVAAAGADVWIGKPPTPGASWTRHELIPASGESDARPSCITRVSAQDKPGDAGQGRSHAVALVEGQDLVFWSVGSDDKPRELGRISAPDGIVDAAVLGRPVALVYGAPVDEDGCARQGGLMRFARVGAPDIDLRAPAPPTNGAIRQLTRGGIAMYLAPLGCGQARKVAFAVVLNDDGAPVSAPTALSDASSFAVTAQGDDVDLWIQRDEEVVWIRAKCAAP